MEIIEDQEKRTLSVYLFYSFLLTELTLWLTESNFRLIQYIRIGHCSTLLFHEHYIYVMSPISVYGLLSLNYSLNRDV
jgi:hypothetical protein